MDKEQVIRQTKAWVREFVIGYNLCPFAANPFRLNRIRYWVVEKMDPSAHIRLLLEEIRILFEEEVETTLLIYPEEWEHYEDYLLFADTMNQFLDETGWRGDIQLATFHPQYEFAGEEPGGPSHYTNRSPYPMLHLIREDIMEQAIRTFPDTEGIPDWNKKQMEQMGVDELEKMWNEYRRIK